MSVQRFEIEGRANYDRWTASLLYGRYAAQPDIGIPTRQEGILGSVSYKIDANWVVYGNALYGLETFKSDSSGNLVPDTNPHWQFTRAGLGIGYVDDCFTLSLNYLYGYSYDVVTGGTPKVDNRIMFQLGLRTIGESGVSQHVGSSSSTH
jgi:LPS-assembly protein